MPYYTYILYSSTVDKYYIGSSEDATKRLKRHNAGHSKSTKSGIPWILAYTEEYFYFWFYILFKRFFKNKIKIILNIYRFFFLITTIDFTNLNFSNLKLNFPAYFKKL